MATRTSVLLIVCHVIRIASATDKQCAKYCRPENTTCFPSPTEWKALAEQLTDGQDALYKVMCVILDHTWYPIMSTSARC